MSYLSYFTDRFFVKTPLFRHPIIKKLHKLTESEPELAEMLAKQLFFNSMVQAGLVDDPRTLLTGLNDLLEKVLDKY